MTITFIVSKKREPHAERLAGILEERFPFFQYQNHQGESDLILATASFDTPQDLAEVWNLLHDLKENPIGGLKPL